MKLEDLHNKAGNIPRTYNSPVYQIIVPEDTLTYNQRADTAWRAHCPCTIRFQ